MFETIMKAIEKCCPSLNVGGTTYIDGLPFSTPVKSGPDFLRPFFAIPMHIVVITTLGDNCHEREELKAMSTFFQRYSDDLTYWTEVGSHLGDGGGQSVFSFTGGFRENEAKWIEPLLLKVLAGETVTFTVPKHLHGWTSIEVTARMLKPSEFPKLSKKFVASMPTRVLEQ